MAAVKVVSRILVSGHNPWKFSVPKSHWNQQDLKCFRLHKIHCFQQGSRPVSELQILTTPDARSSLRWLADTTVGRAKTVITNKAVLFYNVLWHSLKSIRLSWVIINSAFCCLLVSYRLIMEEAHKSNSNNSATPPQAASLQGTTLQAAQLSRVSQQVKKAI